MFDCRVVCLLRITLRALALLADELSSLCPRQKQVNEDEYSKEPVYRPDVEAILSHLEKFTDAAELNAL